MVTACVHMRYLLIPARVSSGRLLHSSSTFVDAELNVWTFSSEKHQFSHDGEVLLVLCNTKQRFLLRNSHLRFLTQRMYRSSALKTSAGQHTVEEFFKRLDLKPPLCLDKPSSKKFRFAISATCLDAVRVD